MFGKLFSRRDAPGSGDKITQAIVADLGRLKEIDPSLPDPAIAYVLGESSDESVLAALKTRAGAHGWLYVWGRFYQTFGKTPEEQAALLKTLSGRQSAMALDETFNADRTARYATVLATLCPPSQHQARATLDDLPHAAQLAALYALGAHNDPYGDHTSTYREVLAKDQAQTRWFDLVAALGLDRTAAHRLLWADTGGWQHREIENRANILGRTEILRADLDEVAPLIATLAATERVGVLRILKPVLEDPRAQSAVIACLDDGSKAVRAQALTLLEKMPDDPAFQAATDALSAGKAGRRLAGAQLMAALGERGVPGAEEALKTALTAEKSKDVIRAIETALSRMPAAQSAQAQETDGYEALDGTWVTIPPVVPLADTKATVTKQDRAALAKDMERLFKMDVQQHKLQEERMARYRKKYGSGFGGYDTDPEAPAWWDKNAADEVCDWLQAPWPLWESDDGRPANHLLRTRTLRLFQGGDETVARLRHIMETGGPDHAIRVAICLDPPSNVVWSLIGGWHRAEPTKAVIDIMRGPDGDVRRLAVDPDARSQLADALFEDRTRWYPDSLPNKAIWPALAERMDLFDGGLGLREAQPAISRDVALKRLGQLPAVPARYRSALIEIAVSSRRDCSAALALLGDADIVTDLIALLDDGRQDIRAGAAELIDRGGYDSALQPLRKRMGKERSEKVRAALLTALRSLGADLSEFLSPDALLEEAEKGLAKVKLDKLDWLGLDTLPKLTMLDGSLLPDTVARWWVALADKLKQPQGNALFELWLNLLTPESADALGRYIIDAWIARDTLKRTAEEVEAMVDDYAKRYPGSNSDAQLAYMRQIYRSEYLSSAAAHKGLLGLAVKADAGWVAPRARRYLKDHGKRVNQAKAFLDMLATQGDGPALQVVVSTATRFPQKTVLAHAEELLAQVAEARGWTTDQLSDRTVPDAGLDSSGSLVLDLPGGQYVAQLTDGLVLEIRNPDGRTVKALPAAKDDQTAAAKKALSASRKVLKEVAAHQADRLKVALATQRKWTSADWQRDMMGHPILRTLAQKLVWQTGEVVFRPTSEGDLIDADDEIVTLSDDATLTLAHPVNIGEATTETWRSILAEEEITQPFPQLDRPALGVPSIKLGKEDGTNAKPPVADGDDTRRDEAITERRGWLSDASAIEKAARDRGWTRGPVEDGGWYGSLERAFPGVDIKAVITFTGGIVGIHETFPAAMETLTFEPLKSGWETTNVALENVPPVVLSEARNDYREIALGQFDPDWEKRSGY